MILFGEHVITPYLVGVQRTSPERGTRRGRKFNVPQEVLTEAADFAVWTIERAGLSKGTAYKFRTLLCWLRERYEIEDLMKNSTVDEAIHVARALKEPPYFWDTMGSMVYHYRRYRIAKNGGDWPPLQPDVRYLRLPRRAC